MVKTKNKISTIKNNTAVWNWDCFTKHAWLVVYFIDHPQNWLLQRLQSCASRASRALPQPDSIIIKHPLNTMEATYLYRLFIITLDELLSKDYDFTLVLSYSSVMIKSKITKLETITV